MNSDRPSDIYERIAQLEIKVRSIQSWGEVSFHKIQELEKKVKDLECRDRVLPELVELNRFMGDISEGLGTTEIEDD